ncbi:MAG: type II toxin-antitoxin system YoeB family toxin, partial [Alphaproteobacteria bacterium]|nr:type II toxin-antitoxin system YoeB family toxin [Alphaproteobacteria bacterium]
SKVKKVLNRTATPEEMSSLYKKRAASLEMKVEKKPFTVAWSKDAKKDYKTLTYECVKRIHKLIEDIKNEGRRGKPETLKSNDPSRKVESRRITKVERIVYERKKDGIEILSCTGHYGD